VGSLIHLMNGTARCAAFMRDLLSKADWKARVAEGLPPEIAEEIPLDLFGRITGLPAEAAQIPWDGPRVRIIEHPAHAQGHAALLIEERRVLVAGDMLSDILMPFPDLDATDPIEDYLIGLRLLEDVADDVDVVIPGHGSVGRADQVRARIQQDRASCMPCVTVMLPMTRASAHRPRSAGIGCPACMNGKHSTWPEEERTEEL
jgi:glyoxylase-like metal-dependent hydrolase (beta-lactamase superfamily II)